MRIPKRIRRVVGGAARRLLRPVDQLAYQRFYDFPFGKTPWAGREEYRQLFEAAQAKHYPPVDEFEHETGYSIDRNWFHELALLTQVVIKESDICYQHGRLLYAALSQYISANKTPNLNILETGTSRGFSALCMARALRDRNWAGKIMTFDVLPHRTGMYWNCIADADGPRTRADLLKDYAELIEAYLIFHQGDSRISLKKIDIPRIHFAFLDGMHTYDYVMHEFCCVKERQKPGDVIFFDDYTPDLFPGLVKAVDEVCSRHGYSKRVITLSRQRGYVVARKNPI